MEPTLPIGSLVYIRDQDEYPTGTIVTFRAGSETYTHRIADQVATTEGRIYATQGDANSGPDANHIATEAILGKAVAYLPYLGIVSTVLGQPAVIGFVLLIALTIIAWPSVIGPEPQRVAQAARDRRSTTSKWMRGNWS